MSLDNDPRLLKAIQVILDDIQEIKGGMINLTRFFRRRRWREVKEKAGLTFYNKKAEYRFKWYLKRKLAEEAPKRGLKIITETKRNGHLLAIYAIKPDKWIQLEEE